ncbi:hypothetical protein D3C71_1691660 [compost metagenome]
MLVVSAPKFSSSFHTALTTSIYNFFKFGLLVRADFNTCVDLLFQHFFVQNVEYPFSEFFSDWCAGKKCNEVATAQ